MQIKFMHLFSGHKCLPFSLIWQVSLTCKTKFMLLFFGHKCLPFSLTCKTKFMLLFFGHKCLPFSLTWQVSLTCKSEFLREIKKKKEKKSKVPNCMKLKYYKEVLNFSNIEYHIIFLIIQIPGQQYHTGDLLKTRVHWTQVLFRTQFCRTRVLKKW